MSIIPPSPGLLLSGGKYVEKSRNRILAFLAINLLSFTAILSHSKIQN